MDGLIDDFSNDTTTSGVLELDGTATGTIDFEGDSDWFAINLTAGETVRIEWDVDEPDFYLRNEFGTIVSFGEPNFDAGGSFMIVEVPESGTYYVDVGGFTAGLDYTLTATTIVDDFAADVSTTGVLTTDGTTSGSIEIDGDVDWFAIGPTGGQTLRVVSDLGFDTQLTLVNQFGDVIAYTQPDFETGEEVLIVQVAEGETLYVQVESFFGTLDYTLTTTALEDDFTSDTGTTGTLEIGGTATGTINFENDSDWFAIELTAGETLTVESDNFDAELSLLDASGNAVAFGDFGGDGTSLTTMVAEGGTYYVNVQSFFAPFDYTLTASTVVDDFSDDTSTTGVLEVGSMTAGAIEFDGDEDWFAIELTAGEIVRIASDSLGADLALRDASGSFISFSRSDYSTNQQVLIAEVEESGTFYVNVDSRSSDLDYILTADVIEDDFAGNSATTGILNVGGTATGAIDFSRDEDWFAITLTAGEAVELRMNNSEAQLILVDEFGVEVFSDYIDEFGNYVSVGYTDFNTNERVLIAQAEESGTFYVNVNSFSSTLDYSLSATVLEDDFTNDNSSVGVLEIGDTVTGTINFRNDTDSFAIELTAGEIIRVATEAFDSRLSLRDGQGNYLTIDSPDYETNENVLFAQVEESGTYYIDVSSQFYGAPNYTLTTTVVVDDFANDTSTSGILELGGMATGAIDFVGDSDWFAIELTAGDLIRIAVDSFDANMTLLNASGEFVSFGNLDFDTNETVLFTQVEESGTYYVDIGSFASTLDYTLTANVIVDDFEGNATTSGVLEVGGTATGALDFTNDSDWFAIELTAGDIIRVAVDGFDANLTLWDGFNGYVTGSDYDSNSNETFFIAQVDDSGTFYVDVTGSSSTLEYTLTASAIVDDFAGDTSTTGVLELGGSVSGSIQFPNESDWFAITITDTDLGLRLNSDSRDLNLIIFDANGEFFEPAFENSVINFSEVGTYFVSANLLSPFLEDYTISSTLVQTVDADLIVSDTGIVDTVANEATDITYSLTNDGTLIRYSNETETLLPNLELGVNTSALSVSQDGQYLFAAQADLTNVGNGVYEATVLRIDAQTLETESFSFQVSGDGYNITDIQATADGTVFLTTDYPGSGWAPFYVLSGFDATFSADVVQDPGLSFNDVRQNTTLDISRDGQFLLLAESNSSAYPVHIFSVEDNAIIASTGHGGFNSDRNAISGEAELVVASGYNRVAVYDFELNVVANLTDIFGNAERVEPIFSQNGEYLLLLNGQSLAVVGTSDFEVVSFFDIPQSLSGIAEVDVSPDGLSLIVTDANGVHYLDLTETLEEPVFEGTSGDDTLIGTERSDTLLGLSGDDILEGFGSDDIISGGTGSDIIDGGDGDDALDGGAGVDAASYTSASSGVVVSLAIEGAQDTDGAGVDTLTSIEGLIGSDFGDVLTGNDRGNVIFGGFGHDILEGGGGGGDILDGGAGIDTASYEGSTNRVLINMAANTLGSGHATGDTLISIENLTGSQFGDILTGDRGNNVINGGDGADVLSGFIGNDTIFGGAGRDYLSGGAGADRLIGGDDVDMARYVGSDAGVHIDLGAGTASGGHAEGDLLNGIEQLFGSSHADSLTGDNQNNFIFGSGGDDTLDGASGIDKLFGGAGADTFVFGAGDDFTFVADWEDDIDSLDLSQYGFSSVEEAMANMTQFGAHVRFFVDGETLLILNADLDEMADDIIIDAATV